MSIRLVALILWEMIDMIVPIVCSGCNKQFDPPGALTRYEMHRCNKYQVGDIVELTNRENEGYYGELHVEGLVVSIQEEIVIVREKLRPNVHHRVREYSVDMRLIKSHGYDVY